MPLDVARMWHEIALPCDPLPMDENNRPPSNWDMWQMQPTWKKSAFVAFLLLGTWAFPPIIFFIVPYLVIQYRKRGQ